MKTGKRSLDGAAAASFGLSGFRVPRFPIEWLDGRSWRLPSGKALAEFAVEAGFLAPLLMKATMFGNAPAAPRKTNAGHAVPSRELR